MKNLIVSLFLVFIVLGLYSCKKPSEAPPGSSVPVVNGRWSLVTDSTYNTVFGSWNGMYIGKAADYYDFEPNGKLSWYENGVGIDSATYTLNSNNKSLTIYYFPKVQNCDCTVPYNISALTDHKMVLLSQPNYSPTQGVFYEIMTLNK